MVVDDLLKAPQATLTPIQLTSDILIGTKPK